MVAAAQFSDMKCVTLEDEVFDHFRTKATRLSNGGSCLFRNSLEVHSAQSATQG